MNASRRKFIQNSAVLLAGTTLLSQTGFAAPKSSEIVGIQLYSVRDDMKTDPLGTLKQLAKMGYTHVEHANYIDRKFYGYTAVEFKKGWAAGVVLPVAGIPTGAGTVTPPCGRLLL